MRPIIWRMTTPAHLQDFGQKIGGARKDIRGNVTRDDVERMSPEERLKLIKKDVVWPTPDYEKMISEQGYTQKAALMVKMLRDSIPATPVFRPGASDEQRAEGSQYYTALVNAAKAVCAMGKTEADLARAFRDAPEARNHLMTINAIPTPTGTYARVESSPSAFFSEAVTKAFAGSLNTSLDMRTAMRYFGSGSLSVTAQRILRRNQDWPSGTSQTDVWLRKHGAEAVQHGEAWNLGINGHNMALAGANDYWRRRCNDYGFGDIANRSFATKDEADEAIRAVAEAALAQKRGAAKAKREALMSRALGKTVDAPGPLVERSGKDWRDGANATGEDYLKAFGLRGGEFGNWVNITERQEVLNKGFDALCDLASVMGLRQDAVSFGGQLAIAFGARGNGHASAHYEPGKKAINLTKPRGAGALAHEIGHAMDHWLGSRAKELGLVDKVLDPTHAVYLTNVTLKPSSADRAPSDEEQFLREFHAAMVSIAVNNGPQTRTEALEKAESMRTLCLRNFTITLNNTARGLEGDNRHRETAQRIREALDDLRASAADPEKELEAVNRAAGAVLANEALSRSPFRADVATYHEWAAKAVASVAEKRALPDDWKGEPISRKTQYTAACGNLDKSRTDPYFGLRHEMFARTFEAVIADGLAERNMSNYFLVDGASGEAFPAGEERKVLKAKFEPLLQRMGDFLPRLNLDPVAEVARKPVPLPQPMSLKPQVHQQMSLL